MLTQKPIHFVWLAGTIGLALVEKGKLPERLEARKRRLETLRQHLEHQRPTVSRFFNVNPMLKTAK
ncbi:hypothetical protein [Spirosoma linguale]|uniref:Uncharacterized protein n=1 Tax=Spirosoma linguale (strain ATCC 33905 / DSM 74 / LMG 10896 / Claus 1) TaxID=504472 RepID=D2QHU5_SPILD|nr:hypothetical protein Slin_3904 [Spirosoma linguale DSM 74]